MSAATYYGVNEILTAFEDQATKPYFSLWVKNAQALYNAEDNMEVAKEKLRKKIEDFARANMLELIVIALHNTKPDKATGLYKKDSPGVLLYCQSKHAPAERVSGIDSNMLPFYTLIEKQQETLNALVSKVNALEAEDTEEEEQIGSEEAVLLDKISGIVNSPLGVLASQYLPRILDRIIPEKRTVTAIAGDTETDLEQTINILFSKGVKLEHLQKLAAMPEAKIQMLLTML